MKCYVLQFIQRLEQRFLLKKLKRANTTKNRGSFTVNCLYFRLG